MRYSSYLVACMATVQSLPIWQRPSLLGARQGRRQSESSRSSHSNQCRDSIDESISQRQVTDCTHTLRTGLQEMCDNPNAGRARTVTEPQNIDYQPETNEPCEAVQAQLHTIEPRQQADELAESTRKTPPSLWQRQMLAQGPWDEVNDPDSLELLTGDLNLSKAHHHCPC